MSFGGPHNPAPLDAELARQREHELAQRAEHYSATHGDQDMPPDLLARLAARVRALLHRR